MWEDVTAESQAVQPERSESPPLQRKQEREERETRTRSAQCVVITSETQAIFSTHKYHSAAKDLF